MTSEALSLARQLPTRSAPFAAWLSNAVPMTSLQDCPNLIADCSLEVGIPYIEAFCADDLVRNFATANWLASRHPKRVEAKPGEFVVRKISRSMIRALWPNARGIEFGIEESKRCVD